MKKEVTEFGDSAIVWIEGGDNYVESFLAFLQLFPDRTARVMRSTRLVAFLAYFIVINVMDRRKRWLKGHRYLLQGFPLVHCGDEQPGRKASRENK